MNNEFEWLNIVIKNADQFLGQCVNRFVLITYLPEMYQISYSLVLLDMLIIRICGVYLPSAIPGPDDNSRSLNQTCCHRTYLCTVWIKIRQLERWQPLWVNIFWYIFCYVPEKDVCFLPFFRPVLSEVQWMCFKGPWHCGTYFCVHMEKCSKGDQVLKHMNLSSANSHQQHA
jgi:hypothetical protein